MFLKNDFGDSEDDSTGVTETQFARYIPVTEIGDCRRNSVGGRRLTWALSAAPSSSTVERTATEGLKIYQSSEPSAKRASPKFAPKFVFPCMYL
jgi:hypothetical protein